MYKLYDHYSMALQYYVITTVYDHYSMPWLISKKFAASLLICCGSRTSIFCILWTVQRSLAAEYQPFHEGDFRFDKLVIAFHVSKWMYHILVVTWWCKLFFTDMTLQALNIYVSPVSLVCNVCDDVHSTTAFHCCLHWHGQKAHCRVCHMQYIHDEEKKDCCCIVTLGNLQAYKYTLNYFLQIKAKPISDGR